MEKIKEMLTGTAGNIVGAIVVLIVGSIVIRLVMKATVQRRTKLVLDSGYTSAKVNSRKATVVLPKAPASVLLNPKTGMKPSASSFLAPRGLRAFGRFKVMRNTSSGDDPGALFARDIVYLIL